MKMILQGLNSLIKTFISSIRKAMKWNSIWIAQKCINLELVNIKIKSRSNISTRLGAFCARFFSCFNFLFVPVWFWGLEFQLLCESPSFHSVTCQCTSSVDFHCSVLFFCPSLWNNHFQSLKTFLQPVSPFLPQDFHDLLSSDRFFFFFLWLKQPNSDLKVGLQFDYSLIWS